MQWTNWRKDKGLAAEQLAKKYLIKQGLVALEDNYSCKLGEIDLIMKQRETLVFIEVKFRQSIQFGGPIMAITPAKKNKITKTAQFYLQCQGLNEYNTQCRFDVITLTGELTHPEFNWITNAF